MTDQARAKGWEETSGEEERFADLIRRQSYPVRDLVFDHLRRQILKGKYAPGERLIEEDIAGELGVSRTPVREAIRKLELEGLAEHIPRRGAIVRELSIQDANEIYSIRSVLEGFAARLAAETITEEELRAFDELLASMKRCIEVGDESEEALYHDRFHAMLYKASHNRRLERILLDYIAYLNMFRQVALRNPGRILRTLEEHEQIVRAIAMHDGELAERRAREHVEQGRQAFLAQCRGQGFLVCGQG
ncbi:MAG: GntR family transcriptional regulator [Clostridia bacterium]|nr:GntR family transcriptional regulator [Clostridia bacterium]